MGCQAGQKAVLIRLALRACCNTQRMMNSSLSKLLLPLCHTVQHENIGCMFNFEKETIEAWQGNPHDCVQ